MHNPRIALAKYAVRGALPQRAATIAKRIRDGEDLKLPFDRLLWCNVSRRFFLNDVFYFFNIFKNLHFTINDKTDWESHGRWNEAVEFLS